MSRQIAGIAVFDELVARAGAGRPLDATGNFPRPPLASFSLLAGRDIHERIRCV
jgi:hypothetical protein